jgi:uncharacterized protein (DUF2267 family)
MGVFDHTTEKANVWIKDMMRELQTDDPRIAYHALGAALQTVRDAMRIDEAAQLAAQLPLLVRGLFYEGWRPAATPVHARRPGEILELFERKSGEGWGVEPERAIVALFAVLKRHVSAGEIHSLERVLPRKLAELAAH